VGRVPWGGVFAWLAPAVVLGLGLGLGLGQGQGSLSGWNGPT
jgi:hypothetical protein